MSIDTRILHRLKTVRVAVLYAAVLFVSAAGAAVAATECDDQAKPALSCPTGYDIVCIPTGGAHWGCGRLAADGTVTEAPSETSADASGTESGATSTQEAALAAPAMMESSAPATSTTTRDTDPAAEAATTDPAAQTQPSATSGAVASPAAPTPADGDDPDLEGTAVSGLVPALAQDMTDGLLEGAEAVEAFVPAPLVGVYEAVLATLGAVAFLLGIWEWVKRIRERKTGACARCGGEKNGANAEKCAECDGTGTVTREVETTIKCEHCKGDGVDPCHHCGGTGKMSLPNPPQSKEELEGWPPCDFCGGSGKKSLGAGRDFGKANKALKGPIACCFCHGKKEITVKLKREVACTACRGSGKK